MPGGEKAMDELLDDLQKRKEELRLLRERLYAPIDPDRNETLREFKAAEIKVRDLEFRIQNSGTTLTPAEYLKRRLNAVLPNAASQEVVELDGRLYMCRYRLAGFRSYGAKRWDRYWEDSGEVVREAAGEVTGVPDEAASEEPAPAPEP
jgi:hypothetical protein